MKPLTKIIRCIPLWMLLLSISCNKEKLLPPATQTGANTFGCLVDGKAWIPSGGGFMSGINPTGGGFFLDVNSKLNIYIRAHSNGDYIHIFLKHITSTGTYLLNKETDVKPNAVLPENYGVYFTSGMNDYYVTTPQHTGVVNITYADTTKGIVAGTFEMELYQKSRGKIIKITKGRFDYKNH